jgi:hypothetical protein
MAFGSANSRYTKLPTECVYQLTFAYPSVYHPNAPKDKNTELAHKTLAM